jgi:hypothetical protein
LCTKERESVFSINPNSSWGNPEQKKNETGFQRSQEMVTKVPEHKGWLINEARRFRVVDLRRCRQARAYARRRPRFFALLGVAAEAVT